MLRNQQSHEMSIYTITIFILVSFIVSLSEGRCRNYHTGVNTTACHMERKEFILTYAECEPMSVCLNVCRGLCPTHVLVSQYPLYTTTHCTCCKPIKHKKYRVTKATNCTTTSGVTEELKTVFVQKILECGCDECNN